MMIKKENEAALTAFILETPKVVGPNAAFKSDTSRVLNVPVRFGQRRLTSCNCGGRLLLRKFDSQQFAIQCEKCHGAFAFTPGRAAVEG